MRREAIVFGFGVAFIALAALWLAWIDRPWRLWLTLSAFGVPCVFGSALYWAALAARYPRGIPAVTSARVVSGAAFLVLVVAMQGPFHGVKAAIGHVVGFAHDARFAEWDATLHGGDPWRVTHALMGDVGLRVIDRLYGAWGLVALALTIWLAWTDHPGRDRSRLAWLLTWAVGGSLCAWIGASAGPAYHDQIVGGDRFAGLIAHLDALDLTMRQIQVAGWQHHVDDVTAPFVGLAAMPSIHVAGAALLVLIGWQRHWIAGTIAMIFAASILIGSVALGWHYAIDGYAGIVLAIGTWRLAGTLTRQFA